MASGIKQFWQREKTRAAANFRFATRGMPATHPLITQGIAPRPEHSLHMRLTRTALRVCAALAVVDYSAIAISVLVSLYLGAQTGRTSPEPVLAVVAVIFGVPTLLSAPLCRFARDRLIFTEAHDFLNRFGLMRLQPETSALVDLMEYEPGDFTIGPLQGRRPDAPGWYLTVNHQDEYHAHLKFKRLPPDPEARRQLVSKEELGEVSIVVISTPIEHMNAAPDEDLRDPDSYGARLKRLFEEGCARPGPVLRTIQALNVESAELPYGWCVNLRWALDVVAHPSASQVIARGLQRHIFVTDCPNMITGIFLENAAPVGEENPGAQEQLADFLGSLRVSSGAALLPLHST
jgi:hypothetical protein